MSAPLLVVVAGIYAYVAVEQLFRGNAPGFFVWVSYACANTALIWYAK